MNFRRPQWQDIKYEIDEQLSRLEFRRWINTNPRIIIILTNLCVIILIIAVYFTVRENNGAEFTDFKKAWYYDLNTGKLFSARNGLVTPIPAPSGPGTDGKPAGVKAYVFSFVREPNESQRFIGFLEKEDPNYVNSKNNGDDTKWGEGKLIKRINDKRWHSATSAEGKEILKFALAPNKNGENPNQVSP